LPDFDRLLAKGWLNLLLHDAGLGAATSYVDETFRRLDKGSLEYGPGSFRGLGLIRVWSEAAEEGLDIGGWSALGHELSRAEGFTDRRHIKALDHARLGGIHGVLAWWEMNEAIRTLRT
jgi:hypothetical protein